jgi:hypothetical protein
MQPSIVDDPDRRRTGLRVALAIASRHRYASPLAPWTVRSLCDCVVHLFVFDSETRNRDFKIDLLFGLILIR